MSLIGAVVERTPGAHDTSQTPFPVSADPRTGFPAATHRSQRQRKSAFHRDREAARSLPPKDAPIPVVQLATIAPDATWHSMMEAQNARQVANMSAQERDDDLRMLQSKFGDMAELAEVLKRAKDLRLKADKRPTSPSIEEVSDEDAKTPARALALSSPSQPNPAPTHRVASPARPILSRRSSVSGPGGSRAGTPGVRFAEVTPRDVFTYPSAPASPKRAALMIEAPPAESSGENIPKVQWTGKVPEVESKVGPAVETKDQVEDMPALVPASTADLASEPRPEPESAPEPKAHPLAQVVSASPPRSPPHRSPSPPKRSPSPPELKVTVPTPTSSTFPSMNQVAFPSSNQVAFPSSDSSSNLVAFPTMSPATPAADSFDSAAARLSIGSQLSTDSDASHYTSSSDISIPCLTQLAGNVSTVSLIPPGSPISIDLEPSTPEAIRLQYFPDEPEPKDVPALQWIMDAVDLPEIPDADPAEYEDEDEEDQTVGLGLDVMQEANAVHADAEAKHAQDVEMKEAHPEEETTPTRDTFDKPKDKVPAQMASGGAPSSTDPEKEALRLRYQDQELPRSRPQSGLFDEKDAPRFNLAGTPIPYDKAKDLPVHDGLHHNARTSAGKSRRNLWAVWMCQVGVGAVCVGVMAVVSWKAAV